MKIESNIKDVVKGLNNFEKKQIPYAVSVALNNTAELSMKYLQSHIERQFNTTTKWNKVGGKFGIKKNRATKKNLAVEIFIPNTNTWIDDHQEGDTRFNQLVPTREFKKLYPNIKTNRGIKSKASKLLADKSKNRLFEAQINGDNYIMQRKKGKVQGKRQYKSTKTGRLLKAKKILNKQAVPLFLIASVVKETKRLQFYDVITREFSNKFNTEFSKAMTYALKTMK